MKKKYVNNLPNEKEVIGIGVSVEDGKLVVEFEFEDEFDPKDGDFLVSKSGKVFIYSKKTPDNSFVYSAYCGVRKDDVIRIDFSNMWTQREGCRFATPEEKSAFLARLEKECHKTWNEDKKQLEDIRWRPKAGETFYFIQSYCKVFYTKMTSLTEYLVEANNCFKTKDAADTYADKFKEMLKNSKAE